MESKVIVIVGPTCSGKTSLSLKIAKLIGSEIVSADSRQIFKLLDIGTAKPTFDELQSVPHHFINILTPDETYNPIKFEADALKIISEIKNRGNIPIVVGGSGLYIKSLIYGITDAGDTDQAYREELYKKRELFGNEYLYNELKKVDAESASQMLPQNWKRVVRALEVFHLTGKSINLHHAEYSRKTGDNFIQYGIEWEREELYKHINSRVENMMEAGLVTEVEKILQMGYKKELNSLNTPGYKEIIAYLEGTLSLEEAAERIKRNTRHYAKRQITWFKADKNINWIKIKSADELDNISKLIKDSL